MNRSRMFLAWLCGCLVFAAAWVVLQQLAGGPHRHAFGGAVLATGLYAILAMWVLRRYSKRYQK